eukprot:718854-Rhodomonas_salina.1
MPLMWTQAPQSPPPDLRVLLCFSRSPDSGTATDDPFLPRSLLHAGTDLNEPKAVVDDNRYHLPSSRPCVFTTLSRRTDTRKE